MGFTDHVLIFNWYTIIKIHSNIRQLIVNFMFQIRKIPYDDIGGQPIIYAGKVSVNKTNEERSFRNV